MVDRPLGQGAATIPRALPSDPAFSFDALKDAMIASVQRHAGARWTDFNAHDPGVTIVEQLCYALTDLAYRADIPIPDLIATGSAQAGGAAHGPLPVWRALTSPPVTLLDWRRILLDRVDGLGNVWLVPLAAAAPPGLYELVLQPTLTLPGIRSADESARAHLAAAAARVFARHRPMGEDLGRIVVLQPRSVRVHAVLHASAEAVPDEIIAAALYRLAATLSPEPRRQSLAAALVDKSAEDVFDGPLPRRGCIPARELGKRPTSPTIAALADGLATIAGVEAVTDLRLEDPGAALTDTYANLDHGLDDDASLPITLIVDGRTCPVDRRQVRTRLQRLWHVHRQRHPTKVECRRAFAPPVGRKRDLLSFAPLVSQFPAAYRLGDGTAKPVDPAAAQLLGFLAIFEMMMVQAIQRLVDAGQLLAGGPPVLSPAWHERVEALHFLGSKAADVISFGSTDDGPLLDLLLALAGEEMDDLPLPEGVPPGSIAAGDRRRGRKLALLRHAPMLAARRGRGFDQRGRQAVRRMAGAEWRLRLLLDDGSVGGAGPRQRLALVEDVLLRPRSSISAGGDAVGVPPLEMRLHAILNLAGVDTVVNRRRIEAALRAAVPAHLVLTVHWVDRLQWRLFRARHRPWCEALRSGDDEMADWASARLRELFEAWAQQACPA